MAKMLQVTDVINLAPDKVCMCTMRPVAARRICKTQHR